MSVPAATGRMKRPIENPVTRLKLIRNPARPGKEPPPSSTARSTVSPPRQGGGNEYEERPRQDHFDLSILRP
jgi:hypothetical protein